MSSFPSKTLAINQSTTYSYIHVKPSESQKPYILFIHGFPSSSYDWHHQVTYFSSKGYGIIAPDCLGYGGTSKPEDMNSYKPKKLADEIVEILNHEKIDRVIGVGHDWGSKTLSRLANYHPDRFSLYAFIDIGYSPPGMNLDFETVRNINAHAKSTVGFECFGYFLFFDEEDAASLLNENWISAISLFHCSDDETLKKYMGTPGNTRIWLTEGKTSPPPAYATEKDLAIGKALFGSENGGFAAPINYYRASLHGIGVDEDKAVPEHNRILHKPTIILTSNNFISKAADMAAQMKPFTPDLTVKHVEAGHWIMMEKPDETNEILQEFFNKNHM